MSFEETALRFWQLCHHSRVYVYFVVSLSTNSLFWPLRLGCLSSSMQSHSCSRLGYVQPVEGANCDGLGNGLRQHLTKNRNILRKMRYDSRLKCSTLMQAGATVLKPSCKRIVVSRFETHMLAELVEKPRGLLAVTAVNVATYVVEPH